MKNKFLLSIIIPCYNSFDLLEKTLLNFENQETNFFQFVIIDDCSSDGSWKNLENYANNSTLNLVIYRNEVNKGPGPSRNQGTQLSSGDYITFVDADDCLTKSFFTEIVAYLDGENDCVIFDYSVPKVGCKHMLMEKRKAGEIKKNEALVFARGMTFGKIYRASIIKNNEIKFLDSKMNEDMPFTKVALSRMEKIFYVPIPYYVYEQVSSSLMHNKKLLLNADYAKIAFEYIDKSIDNSFYNEKEAIYALECVYAMSMTYAYQLKRKAWKKKVKELENRYPNYLRNKYVKKYSLLHRVILKFTHLKMYYSVRFFSRIKFKQ